MHRILVGLVAIAATMNVAVAQIYPTELPGDSRGSTSPVPTTRMPVTLPSSAPANPGDEPIDGTSTDGTVLPAGTAPIVAPPVALEQPLDPDSYVCGAGDVLELNFWGQQNLRLKLTVDLEGRAFIPKVGYVAVAGKTLTAVRAAMKQKVRANYPGLSFDLTVVTPRTFIVHVVENVKHPGTFRAHAIDRVSTVLAKAGVIKEASRRRIAIHHRTGSDTIADLVQYELTGDTRFNPYLLDGDVVRVPFPLTMVQVTGAVRRPGGYELTGTQDLAELLGLAGGLAPDAAKEPIRIVRRNAQQQDTYVDVPVGGNSSLADDDRVIVRGTEDLQRTVLLIGAVVGSDPLDSATTSRRLPFVEGDTVWSLIDRAGGIKAPGDLRRSYISRPRPGGGQELVPIDLDALLVRRDFKADKPIGMGDTIVIPPMQYSVMVEGAVGRAGLYNYNPLFGVPEYIAHAGGMSRTARDLDEVTLIAASGSTKPYHTGMKLQPGDAILVPERNYSRAEVSQLILAGAGLLLSGVAIVLAAQR
ncbi:MAG: SLBB domain-containing protein [Kofleriaceae bacterium]